MIAGVLAVSCARCEWSARQQCETRNDFLRAGGLLIAALEIHEGLAHQMLPEVPALYDIARKVTHESGFTWTDPRTGVTHEPPPHYRCPHCNAVSFNPTDRAERYCGRCHQFEAFTRRPDLDAH